MSPETKNRLHFKLSTASIVLIPIAIGINYLGKYIAGLLRFPLWLDSIGTVLSGMLAGPVIGAASGIINNLIYGVTVDPIATVYAITSAVIGLMAGYFAAKGFLKNIKSVLLVGLIIGLVAAAVSTPLNILFWGGQTGNIWGDALYAIVINNGQPQWVASFLDGVVVDVPDKVVTVLISYFIFKGLPKKMMNTFLKDDTIEDI